MRQLVVLIGVRQPGGDLDALESIGKCLQDMRDWALSQGIPRRDIKIFTDIPELVEPGDPKELSVSDIFGWIDARAKEPRPADQLVVYFSGHGLQSGGVTLWLLPQAPKRDWEAVNLDTCVDRAVWSRFKHVVFIGDCCASVAGNAQFDGVRGASILENRSDVERITQRPVDYLRAARPGKVSLEIPFNGAKVSPYTVQLVKTLSGTIPTVLETQTSGAPEPLVLRVGKLAEELRTSVNSFLRANGVNPPGPPFDKVVSTKEWIALFPLSPVPTPPPANMPVSPPPMYPPSGPVPLNAGPSKNVLGAIPGDLSVGKWEAEFEEPLTFDLDKELIDIAGGARETIAGSAWSARIPRRYHYETPCGFFVTGASVVSAESRPGVQWEVVSEQDIRINADAVELVLIEFEGGRGTMIPAIPGQIGFIHFEDGRLVSLSYEPSGHPAIVRSTSQRRQFDAKSERIRDLRETLESVVTGGDLLFTDINPNTIVQVISDIHYGGRVDFSTLLYLAYAAYTSNLSKIVLPVLANYMQSQFGFVPFDLKILLSLARLEYARNLEFAPPVPLLTRGWSLLQATHERLPEGLTRLSEHYQNASWTYLDSLGVQICRDYLNLLKRGPSSKSGTPALLPVPVDFETFGIKRPAPVQNEEETGFMLAD